MEQQVDVEDGMTVSIPLRGIGKRKDCNPGSKVEEGLKVSIPLRGIGKRKER